MAIASLRLRVLGTSPGLPSWVRRPRAPEPGCLVPPPASKTKGVPQGDPDRDSLEVASLPAAHPKRRDLESPEAWDRTGTQCWRQMLWAPQ